MSQLTNQKIIGRLKEFLELSVCLESERSVLLEGPVGVGKTTLALEVCKNSGKKIFRIDGDSRYTEQKLCGYFDPSLLLTKGYGPESFIAGPLVDAMNAGGILFINELNRLPEGVQNVLLPALDEKKITIPRLGEIKAASGFQILATQNPKEFVATSHLSEAILDRFELISMDYQSYEEEVSILTQFIEDKIKLKPSFEITPELQKKCAELSVKLVRFTRNHPQIKRGASIRGALSITDLCLGFLTKNLSFEDSFLKAVLLSLPTRIEIERAPDSPLSLNQQLQSILTECTQSALNDKIDVLEKKKI